MLFHQGCLNGGGQLRPESSDNSNHVTRADGVALLAKVVDIYNQIDVRDKNVVYAAARQQPVDDSSESPVSVWNRLKTENNEEKQVSSNDDIITVSNLRTDYIARQAVTNALAIKW